MPSLPTDERNRDQGGVGDNCLHRPERRHPVTYAAVRAGGLLARDFAIAADRRSSAHARAGFYACQSASDRIFGRMSACVGHGGL
jgi:hypothetical protein